MWQLVMHCHIRRPLLYLLSALIAQFISFLLVASHWQTRRIQFTEGMQKWPRGPQLWIDASRCCSYMYFFQFGADA